MDYKEFLILAMLLFIGFVLLDYYKFQVVMWKNWHWQKKVNVIDGEITQALNNNIDFLKEKIEAQEKFILKLENEITIIRDNRTNSEANAKAWQSRA